MKQNTVFVDVFCTLLFSLLKQEILLKTAEARQKGYPNSKSEFKKDNAWPYSTVYREPGEIVKLRCRVETSGSRVEWYKNGKPILFERIQKFLIKKKKSSKQSFGYEVLMFNAEQDSSGKYTCGVTATQQHKSWENFQHWMVKIVEAKKLIRTVLHKDIGAAIRLECKVEPWLRVKWKKRGKRLILKNHPHVKLRRTIANPWSNSTSSLQFSAQLNDSGEYECLINIHSAWKKKKKWSLRINAISNLSASANFVNTSFGWWITASWYQHSKSVGSFNAFVVHWRRYARFRVFKDITRVKGTENSARLHVLPNTNCSDLSFTVYGEMINGEKTSKAKANMSNVGNCPKSSGSSQGEPSIAIILASVIIIVVLYRVKPR